MTVLASRPSLALDRLEDPVSGPAVQLLHGKTQVRGRLDELLERGRARELLNLSSMGTGTTETPELIEHLKAVVSRDCADLRAGTVSRCVVGESAVASAPITEHYLTPMREAGEQLRSVSDPPVQLLIVDRALAVVPAGTDGSAAFIQDPVLVDAYVRLFMTVWDAAKPELEARPDLEPLDLSILERLADGATDDSIARALHVGERTVRRRVAELMDSLGAQSRFQLGQRADRLRLLG